MIEKTKSWVESTVILENCKVSENSSWVRHGTVAKRSFIGDDVFVGFRCSIIDAQIGNGTQLAARVAVLGTPVRPVTIGGYCWLCGGAEVQAGVSIGEGSVIGAASLVDKDIPPYSIAVGRPAQIIRQRNVIRDAPPSFSDFLAFIRQRDEALEAAVGTQGFLNADITARGIFTLGDNVILVGRKSPTGQGGLILGDHVTITSNVILEGIGGITIGDYTVIDEDATVFTTTHDYTRLSLPQLREAVVIGSHVSIGKNALIMAGITIGDHARIGPRALVRHNVLPGQIVQ